MRIESWLHGLLARIHGDQLAMFDLSELNVLVVPMFLQLRAKRIDHLVDKNCRAKLYELIMHHK